MNAIKDSIPKAAGPARSGGSLTKRHIRGSSLLLAGRMFSLGGNFLVQILVVRYLSKSDYGALAYALSVVSMGSSLAGLGLERAVKRFVPIYHEEKDFSAMFGTIVFSLTSVIGVGLGVVLLVFGLKGFIGSAIVHDPLAFALLLTLIALSPIQAIDMLFQNLLAALAKPRAIFFRRHVLPPLLKLAAILLVMLVEGNVRLLAAGYLIAGILGGLVCFVLLWRILKEQNLLRHFHPGALTFNTRKIVGFCLPLLTQDLVPIFKTTVAVMLLEHMAGTKEVAEFRAVLSVAGLSLIVFDSFKMLYIPTASRLFVHKDLDGINEVFWQTGIWTTLITFPIFAASLLLAKPITVLFFSERYAEAGTVLAWLAVGHYFHASMGLNAQTLQVYGKVRFIAFVNVSMILAGLALNLLLIPRFGAEGAAMATSGAMVVQNLLIHVGLILQTDVRVFERSYLKVYGSVLLSTIGLYLVMRVFEIPLAFSIALLAIVSLLLIRLNRKALALDGSFPELRRIPVLRFLAGSSTTRSFG